MLELMSDFGFLSDPKFLQLGFEPSLQPWDIWTPAGMPWAWGSGPQLGTLSPPCCSPLGVISSSCLTNWDHSLHAGFADSHQMAGTGFYSNSLTSCYPTIKKAFNCFFSSLPVRYLGSSCSSHEPVRSSCLRAWEQGARIQ